jgi:hypothetical protein
MASPMTAVLRNPRRRRPSNAASMTSAMTSAQCGTRKPHCLDMAAPSVLVRSELPRLRRDRRRSGRQSAEQSGGARMMLDPRTRSRTSLGRNALCGPSHPAAHSHHGAVEVGRSLNALRSHAHHSLGTATPLRSGTPHPCLDEALPLQAIEGGIERSERARPTGGLFDPLADGAP